MAGDGCTTALLTVLALWPAIGSAAGPDNVLFVGWGQKVDNLDPQTSRGNRNWWVLAELYDTLTVLPDQSLQAAPQLAESWTISPDGKEYVFKIRKGVKFSTGNELNAHAVKFALDRLQTIGLGPLYMTRDVYNRTEVVDDYTVKTVLNFPYPVWLAILSQPAVTGIADPKVVKEKCGEPTKGQKCDWLSNNSAGAGAYIIEEFKPNDRVVLVKNPTTGRGGVASTSSGSSWRRSPRSRPASSGSRRATSTWPRSARRSSPTWSSASRTRSCPSS